MRNFSRYTFSGKLSLLVFVVSFLMLNSLASSAFAASTMRNSQPSQGTWKIVHSPGKGYLSGVVAIFTSDIWAVGGSPEGTLTEQWNGTSWSIIPSPSPNIYSGFSGVAVVSAHDIWAVGQEYFPNPNTATTLIEHWNGSNWNIVASPNPNSDSYLNGVAVVSASDIWAVGRTVIDTATQNSQQTLIEHWNGSRWNVISSPNPGTYSELSSVAVVSANDIWAVGYSNNRPLTEQWNGSRWNVVASPDLSSSSLNGVAVVSAHDIWAVGTNGVNKAITLTEHWNGSTWTIVPSPNPPSSYEGDIFNALTIVSANNIWAVGYNSRDRLTDPLIETWNGSKWKVVNSPTQHGSVFLNSVVSVPGTGNLWSVGFHVSPQVHTFVEYYG
ncbi:MAG TPA: hypothetical protein VKR42_02745 [Ktedonobacteraceae bacterium]|nr:hypothetical protein [Ktedonobacteraceae bacterium]